MPASFPSAASTEMFMVRKQNQEPSSSHLEPALLSPSLQHAPACCGKPNPDHPDGHAGLSGPARSASLIPLYFNFGKCHCILVLGSDISDPVKHVVIPIVIAQAEPRELMVVNTA